METSLVSEIRQDAGGIYKIVKRRARLLHSQIYNGESLNAGRSRTGRHHRDRIDPARRTVSSAATDESQQEYKTSEQHRHPRLEALALSSTASELYQEIGRAH